MSLACSFSSNVSSVVDDRKLVSLACSFSSVFFIKFDPAAVDDRKLVSLACSFSSVFFIKFDPPPLTEVKQAFEQALACSFPLSVSAHSHECRPVLFGDPCRGA